MPFYYFDTTALVKRYSRERGTRTVNALLVKRGKTVILGTSSITELYSVFAVKAREGELDFVSRLDFSSPQVMQKGYLTRETVARLTDWLPALGRVVVPAKVSPSALFSFITVETLCVLVERKLAAR